MSNMSTGYVRCETCGEFYSATWPEQVTRKGGSAIAVHAGIGGATADTGGIPCPKCGRINCYRPGLNAGDDAVNQLCLWPELAAALVPGNSGQELWKDPAYQVALNRARALSHEPSPDPNGIVEVVIGKNADGEGPLYRVVRYGRLHEPTVFPCGAELERALDDEDSGICNDETFLYVLHDEGEVVFRHEWDSGGPGAGAGAECVYELAGRFYYPCDWAGLYGPYDTLDEAVRGDLLMVNEASTLIESSFHDDEELASRAEFNGEVVDGEDERLGHEVSFNYIPYVWTESGRFVRKDDDDDEYC